jgi:Ca-activated chloride channel family protein
VYAFGWQDLWLRPDQQASRAIAEEKPMAVPDTASALWRGTGAYQAGDHARAADHFSESNSAIGAYNRGNALAQSGKLRKALEAYDDALALDPDHADTKFNREIISKLLQQQPQQSGQSSDTNKEKTQGQPDSSEEREQTESARGSNDQQQQQNTQDQSGQPTRQDNTPGQNESNADSEQGKPQQLTGQSEDGNDPQTDSNRTPQPADTTAAEQQQALNQWLKQVPDDPGGLLRRKFRHQFGQRTEQSTETQQW